MKKMTSLFLILTMLLPTVQLFAQEPAINMKKVFENTQRKYQSEAPLLWDLDSVGSAYEARIKTNIKDRREPAGVHFDVGVVLDKLNGEWGLDAAFNVDNKVSVDLNLEMYANSEEFIIGGLTDNYLSIPLKIDENHYLYPLSQQFQILSYEQLVETNQKPEIYSLIEAYKNYLNGIAINNLPVSCEETYIEASYGNIPVRSYTYSAQKEYGKNFMKNIWRLSEENIVYDFITVLPIFNNLWHEPWEGFSVEDDYTYTLYVNDDDLIVRYMSEAEVIIDDMPYILNWHWDRKGDIIDEREFQFTISNEEEIQGITVSIIKQPDVEGSVIWNAAVDFFVNDQIERGLEILITYNPDQTKDNLYFDYIHKQVSFDMDSSYDSWDYDYYGDYEDYYYDYEYTMDEFLEIIPHGTEELYESFLNAIKEYELYDFYFYDGSYSYNEYRLYFPNSSEEDFLNFQKQNEIYLATGGKRLAYEEFMEIFTDASREDYELYQEFVNLKEFYAIDIEILLSQDEYFSYFPNNTEQDYNKYWQTRQWYGYEEEGLNRIYSDYKVTDNAFTYEEHLTYLPGTSVEIYEDFQFYFRQKKFSEDKYEEYQDDYNYYNDYQDYDKLYENLVPYEEYLELFSDGSERDYEYYVEDYYYEKFYYEDFSQLYSLDEYLIHYPGDAEDDYDHYIVEYFYYNAFKRLFSYDEYLFIFPEATLEEYEKYQDEYNNYIEYYNYNYPDYEKLYESLVSYEEYLEIFPDIDEVDYDKYVIEYYNHNFYDEDFSQLYSLDEYLTNYPTDTEADYDYYVKAYEYRNFMNNRWDRLLSQEEYLEFIPNEDDYYDYVYSYINLNDTEIDWETFNLIYPDATHDEFEFYANNRGEDSLRIQAKGDLAIKENSLYIGFNQLLNSQESGTIMDFSFQMSPRQDAEDQPIFNPDDKQIFYLADLTEDEFEDLVYEWKVALYSMILIYLRTL